MMIRMAVLVMMAPTIVAAQPDAWYDKAVKSVEAAIVPATAAPGQTVVLKITVDLNPGYTTYPTVQTDKRAAEQINVIEFDTSAALIAVGTITDPPNPDIKAEPALGIKELRTYSGTVTFSRSLVVSPKATAGAIQYSLKSMQLNVCDTKGNCFPTKTLAPTAAMTVQGTAVAVEKAFAADVEKALVGK
jgi:hypothetical protein